MMILVRGKIILTCFFAAFSLTTAFKNIYEDPQPNPFHNVKRRSFSIFSKPPEEDQPKRIFQGSGGLMSHIGNVLHGGSIGIAIRPLAPIRGLIEHAKKIIPGGGGYGTVGKPSHEKPPPLEHPTKDGWLPHPPKEDEWQPPKHEEWEPEPPNKHDWDWEQEKPDKQPDSADAPHWDDIGEYVEDAGVPNIEDIINPRLKPRPKRYIESKIYHLPLKYVSNGRPYKFRFNNEVPRPVKRRGYKEKDTSKKV